MIIGRVCGRDVLVPEEALEASQDMARSLAVLLGTGEPESSLASNWSLSVRKTQWASVMGAVGDEGPGKYAYLEIGSGLGLFVVVGNLLGLRCVGIEPGEDKFEGSVAVAHRVLEANGLPDNLIVRGHGERLELPDESFDVVCSFGTLEHVEDARRMLCEVYRVLKPRGLLFIECPNYRYPYEGHYGLVLPCPLGRRLTDVALRAYGRPTEFLSQLNWVTPGRLRKWLAAAGFADTRVTGTIANKGCEVPVDAYPLPYRFTRGLRALSFLARGFRLPLLRQVARWLEVYPEIKCVARKGP